MRLDHLLSKESAAFGVVYNPSKGTVLDRYSLIKSVRAVFFGFIARGPIAQVWLERTPDKREVTGSTPVRPTSYLRVMTDLLKYGDIAQVGERRPCKAEVTGSNPVISTIMSEI